MRLTSKGLICSSHLSGTFSYATRWQLHYRRQTGYNALSMNSSASIQHHLETRLRLAGLRPTQQRLALGALLFAQGDRHVCAEVLHEEAVQAKVPVSLATVYNTLNQFKAAGLLREIAIEGDRSYFDTNTSDHFHFFDNGNSELMDIHAAGITVMGVPELPPGKVIDRIDVIVRLKDA
jgi:Fur family transcriptional regulator, iron response regulator